MINPCYTLILGDKIRGLFYLAMTIHFIIPIRSDGENNHDKVNKYVIVTKCMNHYYIREWFREILYILRDLHYSKHAGLFGETI